MSNSHHDPTVPMPGPEHNPHTNPTMSLSDGPEFGQESPEARVPRPSKAAKVWWKIFAWFGALFVIAAPLGLTGLVLGMDLYYEYTWSDDFEENWDRWVDDWDEAWEDDDWREWDDEDWDGRGNRDGRSDSHLDGPVMNGDQHVASLDVHVS